MKYHRKSHVDHNISQDAMNAILARFADRREFFIETFELPFGVFVPCGLHGPLAGQRPIPDEECEMVVRGDRAGPSRVCDRDAYETSMVTVIGGPCEDEPCILYTAYGGPAAPREPWDPSLTRDEDRAVSEMFWREHALSRDA